MIGRGGVKQVVVLGSTAPGTSGRPGTGVFLQAAQESDVTTLKMGQADRSAICIAIRRE
jgi:hypothetical protein